jgi:predicted small lipoprotein YifL
MRQNHRRFFHVFIITSVCCVVMAGCGHKTDPVYVPDSNTTAKG